MPAHFGRYEIMGTIASGGMATVHLGRAVGEGGFERLVAIKVMHPHIAEDESFRSMFLDEARLAARIRHPNVVGVLDVQKEGGQLFLVMEFVDGPSLHQLRRNFRKRNTTLPIGMTLRIFVDALTGLHAAHELTGADGHPLNLVHRDVTPQNILVGRDGVTRITDFGVARAEARITSTRGGQLKGKISYMAPEQLRNEPLDARADVYAAGCALWEALAGRRLYKADSEAAIVHMIISSSIQGPRKFNDEVTEQLEYVCMRALSADREERYADAAAFADAIEASAKVSGIAIPSTRQLAAFVRSLPELEGPPQPTSTPSAATSLSGIDAIPPISDATHREGRKVLYSDTGSDVHSDIRSDVHPSRSGTTTNAVVAEVPGTRSTGRAKWIAAVAAAMVTGGAISYFALRPGPAPAAGQPAATEPMPAAAPVETVETQPSEPASEPDPEMVAEPEEETASDEANKEAEPVPEAKTAPPRVHRPTVSRPTKPDEPADKEKEPAEPPPKGPHGPGYNPTEL